MSGDMGETNPQAPTHGADGAGPHALHRRAKKPVVFGKYELLARFRVGGMAEVWTAKRLGGGEQPLVALKRILPSFTDESDYLAMFRDEARLAQQLSHPCIVATLETGHVDDHPYIALEHIRGQNVAALIRKARELEKAVPQAMALRIAIDVCRALEHAHSLTDSSGRALEIVHRDVSPTNILLGYDGAVKLIDFGIAKSNEQLMRTQAGLLKGKHGYLSPEQAAGEPIDARSDLFSLAICVWEMLAAKRLFLGASDFSSIVRVREAVVPPLGDAGVSDAIELVLQRALSREPSARYSSATELREAFEQVGEGQVGEDNSAATPDELASYLREVFADEIALEAGDEALEAPTPYEGTGLLDAFDDLEPVSTVSTLAALPDAPVASDDDAIDEDLELSEVAESVPESVAQSAPAGEGFELVREPEADTELDDGSVDGDTDLHKAPAFAAANDVEPAASLEATPDAAPEETPNELVTQESPFPPDHEGSSATEPLASPTAELAASSNDEDEPDEPTRVVAYRSIESGEVTAQLAAAQAATDAAATNAAVTDGAATDPSAHPAAAPTLPGMGGVEWDDEELSTHLYDGPSAAAHEQDAGEAPVSARASIPPFSSRPSVAPFSSRPSAAPLSSRPGAMTSVPPIVTAPVASATQRSVPKTPAWLLPALIAAAAVALFIALSMFQGETPGSIQLTTQPADARVLFDGQPATSTLSPFVIMSVKPGEQHVLEVSADGYRTWSAQLTVGSGQTLQLPVVVLVPLPPSTPVATPLPRTEPVVPRSSAQNRVESNVRPASNERRVVPAPTASTPTRVRASEARGSSTQAIPRVTAAPRTPAGPPVVQAPAATGSDTGMLRVNSRPWAQVHVDGRLVGNTPQMALRLSPGHHTILLLNPELGMRKTFTVQIRRGAVTTKIVELAR